MSFYHKIFFVNISSRTKKIFQKYITKLTDFATTPEPAGEKCIVMFYYILSTMFLFTMIFSVMNKVVRVMICCGFNKNWKMSIIYNLLFTIFRKSIAHTKDSSITSFSF